MGTATVDPGAEHLDTVFDDSHLAAYPDGWHPDGRYPGGWDPGGCPGEGAEDLDAGSRAALLAELDAQWPPPGLIEDTPAGPRLAALLNTVGLTGLPAGVLVECAAGALRLASWAAAREAEATAELTERVQTFRGVGPGPAEISAEEMAAHEIGAGLALSPTAARLRVELARALRRLPLTRLALAAGRIDVVKARAIVDTVAPLDDETAAAVEAKVMARAGEQTAAQLRACLRRAVISLDPAGAETRRQARVADRGVWREPHDDGMGRLEWVGPLEQVEATYRWITGKAQQAQAGDRQAGGPVRTLDQARSDVLADLGALGLGLEDLPRRHGRRPNVDVVIAYSTLIGADDEPAELAGVGPLTAEVARRIAAGGTWRRLLVDPRTGRLDEMSTESYQPPQDVRDAVIARDKTCRGLGCRLPAECCDLDHRIPHPDGPTSPANLDPACRSWHRVKTLTDTTVEADEHGGLWITLPSGRRYHRPAEPLLDHPGLLEQPPAEEDPPDDPDPRTTCPRTTTYRPSDPRATGSMPSSSKRRRPAATRASCSPSATRRWAGSAGRCSSWASPLSSNGGLSPSEGSHHGRLKSSIYAEPRSREEVRPVRVCRGLDEVEAQGGVERSVVTIGNFDGVHRGHQQVVAGVVARARELGATSVVTTFDPHPMTVIHPDSAPLRLTAPDRRLDLLEYLGVETVLVLPFTRELSLWEPSQFVERVLVNALKAVEVHVGENFRYGHRAAGNIATLRDAGARHGFDVRPVPLAGDTTRWSSTYVRQCLAEGDVAAAASALGRPHRVEGPVVEGDKRGRGLGYPTANLSLDDDVAVPADGVYAGWLVRADGTRLPAAISIGTNPTFGGTTRRVEAYVLDRDDLELYGEKVGVEFAERLRETVTFDGVEALLEQMSRDVDQARAVTSAS